LRWALAFVHSEKDDAFADMTVKWLRNVCQVSLSGPFSKAFATKVLQLR
jgi:hypothetical protein